MNSQVPIAKIEYEFERPTWENPLAQMRRYIAIAEPEILNQIGERATHSIRTKTHLDDLDCKDSCSFVSNSGVQEWGNVIDRDQDLEKGERRKAIGCPELENWNSLGF